ncbi:MAG: heme exporter protein CcmD [Pseudomonadota bacterium]|jgi:heme exporter protein D
MPDLGKYAFTVLAAYGATILPMAGLVLVTLVQGARVRRQLRTQEDRMDRERT